jgi:hypothetical protein
MKRICIAIVGMVAVVVFSNGCKSGPPPASRSTVWGKAPAASADWALKCDACGTVYAQNTYAKPVSLAEHRKWAATKGCSVVVKDGRTYDVCGDKCQKKLQPKAP